MKEVSLSTKIIIYMISIVPYFIIFELIEKYFEIKATDAFICYFALSIACILGSLIEKRLYKYVKNK